MIINVHWSSCKIPVILVKLEFSRKSFEKFSIIRIRKNVNSGSRVVPHGWTDRQTVRQTDMTKATVARENNKKEQVYHKNIKHAG
jgi:hypothetical protein